MTQLKDIIRNNRIGFHTNNSWLYCMGTETDGTPQVEVPSMENFYDHPLLTWPVYDINGYPCIKVKYLVDRKYKIIYVG